MAKTSFTNTAADETVVELEKYSYKYDAASNQWRVLKKGPVIVDLSTAVTWNTINGKSAIGGDSSNPIYLSSMSTDPSPEGATPGTGTIVVPSGGSAIMPADYWIWSDNNTVPALVIDIPCTFTNNGNIIGKGGEGGNQTAPTGEAGGPAIQITAASDVTINNETGAYIAGGGGGGAGTTDTNQASEGGGGGAGGGNGGTYTTDTGVTRNGGAGGTINQVGGNGTTHQGRGVSQGGGAGGAGASFETGGAGGGRILPGVGGVANATAGDGGSAGNAGASGGGVNEAAGGGGWGANGGQTNGVAGAAGGAAITGNAYTQGTWDGTVYGSS